MANLPLQLKPATSQTTAMRSQHTESHPQQCKSRRRCRTQPTPLIVVVVLVAAVVATGQFVVCQNATSSTTATTPVATPTTTPAPTTTSSTSTSSSTTAPALQTTTTVASVNAPNLAATATTTEAPTTTPLPMTSSPTEPASITTTTAASGTSTPVDIEPTTMSATAAAANNQKLKPVNFTLVDEIFEASLDDEQVLNKWRNMDAKIQDAMKSILKMIFPQIVSISQDAKVSGDCSGGILKWILNLRNLRSWAIKMLDATGKPTSGIFQGSLTMFGNYRQCLDVRAPDEDEIEANDSEQFEEYFRGQYCVLHLKPWLPAKRPFYHLNSTIDMLLRKNYKYYEKTLYDELAEIAMAFQFVDIRMDLCVPSTCTVGDIQRVADLLSRQLEMRSKVMRCDIAPRETNTLAQLDEPTLYWLALPVALFALTLLASLIHACVPKPINRSTSQPNVFRRGLESLAFSRILVDRARFSHHGKCHPSSDFSSKCNCSLDKALPLYGLRNVFVFWFIVVQMTVELKYQYLRESLMLRNMVFNYWPFQVIVNSSFLFESLIIITAFTYSYSSLGDSVATLVARIFDKYVRFTTSIVTLIAMTIAIPIISIGSPVWRNFIETQANVCKSTGFLDLFFLQNFISYDKMCLPHTWLLCVELQLVLLSIPLILLLNSSFRTTRDVVISELGDPHFQQQPSLFIINVKRRVLRLNLTSTILKRFLLSKAGLVSFLIVIGGFITNFVIVYTKQLPPAWFYTFPDVAHKSQYFGDYLCKTWTHISVFVIGLVGGHLCKVHIQLSRLIRQSRSNHTTSNCNQEELQCSTSSLSATSTNNNNPHRSTSTIMDLSANGGDNTSSRSSSASSSSAAANSNGNSKVANCLKQFALFLSKVAALACMSAIIFSTYSWSTQQVPDALISATYDASSKVLWAVSLVWLMNLACTDLNHTKSRKSARRGQQVSIFVKILSHPLLTLLGRLSFLAYLISPFVNNFVLAVEEQSLFPSLFMMFHVIIGNIVITYALAFILAIVIEQPLRRLFGLTAIISPQVINQHHSATSHTTQQVPNILLTKPGGA